MHKPLTTNPARAIALAASLCLSLLTPTACDDNSDATPPPTTTPPSSTPSTPSPSKPAPPTLPPSAKGLTVQSADAFTRFYLQLLDHAARTGDTTPLSTWSDAGCGGCRDLVQDFTSIYSAGGSYGGDFTYSNVTVTRIRLATPKAEVKFEATVGRHTVREHRGATPITYPGETVRWRVALIGRSSQWIMYEMEDEAG